ncbi:Na+/H+ antiporter NhaA [Streptomyces sp. NPDC006173]|uniref:Na+/H+ antiporter NhaA n=1 Tax=Streptomyces sp. NPDC006173 TaxID=3155349 RepID=UPI0033CD81A3
MNGDELNKTRWSWSRQSTERWRTFVQARTASAGVLVVAVVTALLWATIDVHSYEAFLGAHFTIGLDTYHLSLDVHEWINAGLMSLFFFVVGLEARRELDVGELRDRRWLLLSAVAGVISMVVPALIYVTVNTGRDSVHAWGTAMSTDSAFALGILAVFGSRLPASLRAFILTISVIDDLVGLVVIALFYSEEVHVAALLVALGTLLVIAVVRRTIVHSGVYCALLSVVVWVALYEAGVDPVVTGLAVGGLVIAYPAPRGSLERASNLFLLFREQPTPERQRSAVRGLATAISPNERLERKFLPWVSFGIVPVFALTNAGIEITSSKFAEAFASPITLGILIGCLAGKTVAVLASISAANVLSSGKLRPNVGWGSVTAGGAMAGATFTVSLLIASLVLEGEELDQARIGILATIIGAFVLTWAVSAVIGLLPPVRRARALLGDGDQVTDLAVGVDVRRDRIRGPAQATVTVVEYGDFECPYCGQAEPVVRRLLGSETDVRYVWRHLPLRDVHPNAQLAAEAAEAAARQNRFWEMHDLLLERQDALTGPDLLRHAQELGLDVDAFGQDLEKHRGARQVAEDVSSADLSSASGTPTFFINGRRHHGSYDIATLTEAVEHARQSALAGVGMRPGRPASE